LVFSSCGQAEWSDPAAIGRLGIREEKWRPDGGLQGCFASAVILGRTGVKEAIVVRIFQSIGNFD
jgi:hypothetical protein